jgi:hypothetical protein
MSRRYYDHTLQGEKVRIALGFDQSSEQYSLQIEKLTACAETTVRYLHDSTTAAKNIADFRDKYHDTLQELKLQAPTNLFDLICNDAITHRGPLVVEHFADESTRVVNDEQCSVADRHVATPNCYEGLTLTEVKERRGEAPLEGDSARAEMSTAWFEPWPEDAEYSVSDWKYQVKTDGTRLGYLAWAACQRELEQASLYLDDVAYSSTSLNAAQPDRVCEHAKPEFQKYVCSWCHSPAPGVTFYEGEEHVIACDRDQAVIRARRQVAQRGCFASSCITITSVRSA